MKMQFVKKKKKSIVVWGGILVTLFLIVFLFWGFSFNFIKKSVMFISQPILELKNKILLGSRTDLVRQNLELKQKIMKLETRQQFFSFVVEENVKFKEFFSAHKEKKFLMASILSRPGYGIYNALVVDVGFQDGVQEGDLVTAFGDVLLGHIFDVGSGISRVRLVSHPDSEINVFVNSVVSAIAIGVGGENLEIELPQAIEIKKGDIITTLGTEPLFLGVVEEIIKEPISPFQKILFRLPVNIQELQYVYLIK